MSMESFQPLRRKQEDDSSSASRLQKGNGSEAESQGETAEEKPKGFMFDSLEQLLKNQLGMDDEAFSDGSRSEMQEAFQIMCRCFWQAFTESPAYFPCLARLEASPLAYERAQKILVYHSSGYYGYYGERLRYSLLIMDPGYPEGKINRIRRVRVAEADLRRGWAGFSRRHGVLPDFDTELLERSFGLAARLPLGLIIIPQPRVSFLSHDPYPIASTPGPGAGSIAQKVSSPWHYDVPRQPIPVCNALYGAPQATVGLIARADDGRQGFTTAAHATNGEQARAFIDAEQGTIICSDPVRDTCFVLLDNPLFDANTGRQTQGYLSGQAPADGSNVFFDGIASSSQTTTVIGHDVELPYGINPFNQLKLYTKPDTLPGDSGAALLNTADQVIGFASYRSMNIFPYSAWIWAESVYQTLDRNIY